MCLQVTFLLNNDLIQKNHLDSSDTSTFPELFMNQKATFLVFVSDGNNAINKEIFGCDNDNYNNGFGAVILSVKMSVWRGLALAVPLDCWGVNCYIGQICGEAGRFSWRKI